MPSKDSIAYQVDELAENTSAYRLCHENTAHLVTDGAPIIIFYAIERIRKAVVSTMGPNGKLAIIKDGTAIKTTKDGVTVAKSIRFNNEHMELVARAMTEPAIKTDNECGDGTTTTIQLTAELAKVLAKFPLFSQQKEIETAVKEVVEELTRMSIRIDVSDPRLKAMALTSSNQDDELTNTILSIYQQTPERFPEIELREYTQISDKIERIEGRPLKMRYSNPTFGRGQAGGDLELPEFRAVIIDDKLMRMTEHEVLNALRNVPFVTKTRNPNYYPDDFSPGPEFLPEVQLPPLLIIARSIEQDVLTSFIKMINKLDVKAIGEVPRIVALSTDEGGAIGTSAMQDLGVILNAPVLSSFDGIEHVELKINRNRIKLGSSRSLLLEMDDETKARITTQADELEQRISEYSLSDRYSLRARMDEKRLRSLRGDLVIVYVGGETNSEVKERVDRYEDVVKAIRSGLINGILPGCGSSLMWAWNMAQNNLPPIDPEIKAELKKVFSSIYRQLMTGMLKDNELEQDITLGSPRVINLATGQSGDEAGVYDTAYSTITALKGGFQTAKILANTSSLITGDKLFSVSSRA